MLSKSEFDFLYFLKSDRNIANFSQRIMAEELGISLGKINHVIRELIDKRLVYMRDEGTYRVTEQGVQALEPYKVKNAVIMAAGMSSRFAPLSYEKPKGLLVVKGEVLIEREIRQLQEAGITDITIVVGYMKEKFFYLEEKFGIKIVVNEDYYRYNNTSTLIRVLDQLSNTYICSSDNFFLENVFEQYVYQPYYSSVYAAGKTDEYCLEYSHRGRIKNVTIGGYNSWYMLGHAYFDQNFSDKFKIILSREYESLETKEHLWEDLYIRYINELDLYIRKYSADKVFEFDSLDELRNFDPEYINNTDSKILRNICKVLSCEIKDIVDIKAIKAGLTNTSFSFTANGQAYVYRHPGRGTEKYINRKSEADSMKIAAELGLDDTFIYMDSKEGWKLSKYIPDVRELDYHNPSEVSAALRMMRKLHNSGKISAYDFDIWKKTLEFIERLQGTGKLEYDEFETLHTQMERVHDYVNNDNYARRCLCHCDCYSPNFLLDRENNMYLIDWEYSGNDDPASDLGTFICCSDYNFEESVEIIEKYLHRLPEDAELGHYLGYIAMASYYWYIWALYQETRGNSVGSWLYKWYKNSRRFAAETIKNFEQ